MSTANDRAVLNHILNPLLPTDTSLNNTVENDAPIIANGIEESRRLEVEGVQLAENGEFDQAIEKFNEAIQKCPKNPSAFNNRAQALRLAGKTDEAMNDLDEAINLSNGFGKSACQAFIQRAMIHRLQGNEEDAKADFQRAADLGSSFAKMQVIALNPYAAMCNKMLSEIFTNLKEGKNGY
ncbi:tetratricopeptide repeat protein [Dictyocaulus viviparus]|uniref:Tetratricopeptide repeat protein n=1 Tax=Dictyocaulus viviparus TaxID=29172 RepID=A0A0D8Y2H7_DICVI|nr:tetratricopeptide repeat protein [Dictyocaulus viviparus]